MLRLFVVLLLLANGLYFAWSQGHLAAWGLSPSNPAEPERIQNQLKPEALKLITPKEAKALETQAQKPAECLQSELLTEVEVKALRTKLGASNPAWPTGSWSIEKYTEAASWMVFMGPYPNAQLMDKKKQELRRMSVGFDPIQSKTLGEGLMLASSSDKAAMDKQLAALNKAGVRTARVAPLRVSASGQVLNLPAVNDDLKPQIEAIRASLPVIVNGPLRKCAS